MKRDETRSLWVVLVVGGWMIDYLTYSYVGKKICTKQFLISPRGKKIFGTFGAHNESMVKDNG